MAGSVCVNARRWYGDKNLPTHSLLICGFHFIRLWHAVCTFQLAFGNTSQRNHLAGSENFNGTNEARRLCGILSHLIACNHSYRIIRALREVRSRLGKVSCSIWVKVKNVTDNKQIIKVYLSDRYKSRLCIVLGP